MTAVAVEITTRPAAGLPEPAVHLAASEPAGLIIVDDVESLGEGSAAPCNDDNPYQG
ncbi:hypothetical protein AB0H18_19500 [Streptomyces sp. NPDC020766]|uniref:hypothetical protein n=1 Tax=Streptomyces sp. NPDC020766 TaxID=3155011 RepID=UPI0033EDE23D